MGKSLGSPKTGGRQRGVPNKRTLILQEALSAGGIDVVSEIVKLLPQLSPELKLNALQNLLPYLYPKRRPIDDFSNQPLNERVRVEIVSPGQESSFNEVDDADDEQPSVVIRLPDNGR